MFCTYAVLLLSASHMTRSYGVIDDCLGSTVITWAMRCLHVFSFLHTGFCPSLLQLRRFSVRIFEIPPDSLASCHMACEKIEVQSVALARVC